MNTLFVLFTFAVLINAIRCQENSESMVTTDGLGTIETLEEQRTRICSLPMAEGPCKDQMSRYYFDSEGKKCKEFVYSGCFGNENNFLTREACEDLCVAVTNPPTPATEAKPES